MRIPTLVALCAASLVGGCAVDKITAPETAEPDAESPDVAEREVSTDAGPDAAGLTVCNSDPDCPEGMFCHAQASVCTECVSTATRCGDDGIRERCLQPVFVGFHQVEEGFYEDFPCEDGTACVEDGGDVQCIAQTCEPFSTRCTADGLSVETCDKFGTGWETKACPASKACLTDSCEPLQHNVLVLMDSSISMIKDFDDLNVEQSYPACETLADPKTKLTTAKAAFRDAVDAEAVTEGAARIALQRFPQIADLSTDKTESCTGHYVGFQDDRLPDDDDSHDTRASAEDWFAAHVGLAIVEPFPANANDYDVEDVRRWMDLEEKTGFGSQSCESDDDCENSRCEATTSGDRRCIAHTNPELRAAQSSPIGRSLFYAGEYFRRYVLIDGQACDTDADCASAGYLCYSGKCGDPYRECKRNRIILFSDGGESQHASEDDWYNPKVQARRLAYGLGCETDADCRGEATCVLYGHRECVDQVSGNTTGVDCSCGEQACVSYCEGKEDCDVACQDTGDAPDSFCAAPDEQYCTDTGALTLPVAAGYARSDQGVGALSSSDGTPISIKVDVISFGGDIENLRAFNIANAGGGQHVHIDIDATSDLQGAIREGFENFLAIGKCEAKSLEGR